ncbi:serine hydrolase domain-containing protein [Rhizobium oryziradicis]|uniref:6-aminohexanoate hydrolase n=1 Tax=Rhizobium oryziradicis TaxID=1867956 RepID=A0A1Q8ZQX1_9HYPH|nr:serine hydrolase [Rhizobium oryziradicis]OLP44485.1 6-aminohexanoate hydrolase [Rhizobium oryziradicis]
MALVIRGLKFAALGVAALTAGAAGWLAVAPPEILRVGTGYAAKIVCSNVFIAHRDPDTVLQVDVQAAQNPALKLLRQTVDREANTVTTYFLGVFSPSVALYRPGLGCANVVDGRVDEARKIALPAVDVASANGVTSTAPWPEGMGAAESDPALKAIFADPALMGQGMRAVLVMRGGKLIGEAYGKGFGPNTPLLGWSMTKTVTAALVGLRVQAGAMRLDQDHLFPQWSGDGRSAIKLSDLMAMQSGLMFDEDYSDLADVTRMLYLERDQVGFVASRPLIATPGTTFAYSTGSAVLVSRLWMNSLPTQADALRYPKDALFTPLGMTSATLEADENGTFDGGSYLYATARDWGKFAQMLLQDGVWNGKRLLPIGYLGMMQQRTKASNGIYTQGFMWRVGPQPSAQSEAGLPADTVWMQGHDGQTIAIVPSAGLIVMRMGLTPLSVGYKPQNLLRAVVAALQ